MIRTLSEAQALRSEMIAVLKNKPMVDLHSADLVHPDMFYEGGLAIARRTDSHHHCVVFVMKGQCHSVNLVNLVSGYVFLTRHTVTTVYESHSTFEGLAGELAERLVRNKYMTTEIVGEVVEFHSSSLPVLA